MKHFIAISAVLVSLLCSSHLVAQEEALLKELAELQARAAATESELAKQRSATEKAVQDAVEMQRVLAAQQLKSRWHLSERMQLHAMGLQLSPEQLYQQYNELLNENAGANNKPGKFWIGVQCEAAPETQLNAGPEGIPVTINTGLMVNSVVEGSPAESAGIQTGDVLLQFNRERLRELQVLVDAISETGEQEARLHFVRDGEIESVMITPAKREEEEKKAEPAESVDFSYVMSDAIPEGYEINIHLKKGESPKVTFLKEGDEDVTVTLETIDQLPGELLPFGGKAMEAVKDLDQESQFEYSIEVPWSKTYVELYNPHVSDDKLEKIEKALEELRKEVLELKAQK